MIEFWSEMTEAQATVLAAGLTVVAAIVGVMLGYVLFGGKVATLQQAVKESEDAIEGFRATVDANLRDVAPQMEALMDVVGQLRREVQENAGGDSGEELPADAAPTRDNLKQVWHDVRDVIDDTASDRVIDGRTRARYARIPRYSYRELIDTLDSDGRIAGHAHQMRRANEIWQNYQRRPEQPSLEEFAELRRLLAALERAELPTVPTEAQIDDDQTLADPGSETN